MSKHVVMVDNDHGISQFVRDALRSEGLRVEWFPASPAAIQRALKRRADLILLAPPSDDDGLELCRQFVHRTERAGVLILTARPTKEPLLRALALGADDFIVKPFSLDELLVRVTTALQHGKQPPTKLKLGRTVVDFERYQAKRGERPVGFTDREFQLLRYLADQAGEVVSREDLLRKVWGYDKAPTTRTVDHFIFRLRRKIEVDPHHPRYLRTAYGDGYRLTTRPVGRA